MTDRLQSLYESTASMADDMLSAARMLRDQPPLYVGMVHRAFRDQVDAWAGVWAGGEPDSEERKELIEMVVGKKLHSLTLESGSVVMTPVAHPLSVQWRGGVKILAHEVATSNRDENIDRLVGLVLGRKLAHEIDMSLHHVGLRVASIPELDATVAHLAGSLGSEPSWVPADDHLRVYIPVPGEEYQLEVQLIPRNREPGVHWDYVMKVPAQSIEWIGSMMEMDNVGYQPFDNPAEHAPVGALWVPDSREHVDLGIMGRESWWDIPPGRPRPSTSELEQFVQELS